MAIETQLMVKNEYADRPKRRTDVSVRLVEGEVVVLDHQTRLIHQLNQTASYIWHRCDGQSTVSDIAAQLAQTFEVDVSTAVQDVTDIIRRFFDLKLLESC